MFYKKTILKLTKQINIKIIYQNKLDLVILLLENKKNKYYIRY